MRDDLEPAVRLILEREAHYRSLTSSNKELSRRTGLTPAQVQNFIGRIVRAKRVEVAIDQPDLMRTE